MQTAYSLTTKQEICAKGKGGYTYIPVVATVIYYIMISLMGWDSTFSDDDTRSVGGPIMVEWNLLRAT